MLNAELVTPVNPAELKLMVAPVTEFVLKAVRPLKVAVPLDAFLLVVPPKVQVPWTGVAVIVAELCTTLPEASCTVMTGCAAKAPPSATGALGCVDTASFAAAPPTNCVIELVL